MAFVENKSFIRAPVEAVFGFLTDPHQLPYLLDDFMEVKALGAPEVAARGGEYSFEILRFGWRFDVRYRLEKIVVNRCVVYRQTEGFFKLWRHEALFEDKKELAGTQIVDRIHYELPFGLLGHLGDDLFCHKDLKNILQKRAKKTQNHFDK